MFSKTARAMGFADFDSYNLRHYVDEIVNGAFAIGAPTVHVERLTGAPVESFPETAAYYAEDVARLAPNVTETTTGCAMAVMLRMLITPPPDLSAAEGSARLRSLRARAPQPGTAGGGPRRTGSCFRSGRHRSNPLP